MKHQKLDIAIAKEIFGYRYINISTDANGKNACKVLFHKDDEPSQAHYNLLPRMGVIDESFFVPSYSESFSRGIALAQKVNLDISILKLTSPYDLAQRCLDHFRKKK